MLPGTLEGVWDREGEISEVELIESIKSVFKMALEVQTH